MHVIVARQFAYIFYIVYIVLIDEQKLLCLKLLLIITVLTMNLKKLGDIMSKSKRLSMLNIAIGVYLTTCLRNFVSTNH